MRAGGSGDGELRPVDASLAASLLYEPLPKDGRWLFPPLERPPPPPGAPVLVADPSAAFAAALPPGVAALLRASSWNGAAC